MDDLIAIQRRLRRQNIGNVGRQLRDRTNPLEDMEPDEIFRCYRFYPEDILMIVGLVAGYVAHPTARALAVYAVLVSLQYLATGPFHTVLSDTVNVHSTTVGRVIRHFLGAMDHIANQFIRFPAGGTEVETKLSFARIAGKCYTQYVPLILEHQDTVFARLSAWSLISTSSPPPLFFAEIGGPASAKDCLLILNLPPEVTKTKSHTFPLAVSAIQR